MDVPFDPAATQPLHSETLYQESVEAPSAIDQPHAKLQPLQDHVAVEISSLIDAVRRALESDRGAAAKNAARLAALLASECIDDPRAGSACGGLAPWQHRKIQSVIEEGLETDLPVEALAKLVSLSRSYFCRAFKETFGESPHAYVIKRRIERAKTLMLTTSESLSQIAFSCGLSDQAHFCRCFRQVMGVTPGNWRRSHASEPQPSAYANVRDARRL